MTDDFEDQLSAMFERRAGDVRTAPPIDFTSADKGRTRLNLTPFAVAASIAAVVLVAGGSVVGIRSIHRSSPAAAAPTAPATSRSPSAAFVDPDHPTDSAGNCLYLPPTPVAAWNTAIRNGTKVTSDHPDNTAVSVNGAAAEYLVVQSSPNTQQTQARYGQWTLALFHGASGQDIVKSPAGTAESPIADPSAAVTAGWITYGLVHPQQNSGYFKVQLYNRSTKAITTVTEVTDGQYQGGTEFLGTPVIYNNQVYWLRGQYDRPAQTLLQSYDLRSGGHHSVPAANASQLFAYGDGLAVVNKVGSKTTVANYLGKSLPNWAIAQMAGAELLTYAGPTSVTGGQSNLSWVVPVEQDGNAAGFYDWSEDRDAVQSDGGSSYRKQLPTGAFVAGSDGKGKPQILDDRAGIRNVSPQLIPLPMSLNFQALVGPDLLFSVNDTKDGAASFLLVKVSSLPKPINFPGC